MQKREPDWRFPVACIDNAYVMWMWARRMRRQRVCQQDANWTKKGTSWLEAIRQHHISRNQKPSITLLDKWHRFATCSNQQQQRWQLTKHKTLTNPSWSSIPLIFSLIFFLIFFRCGLSLHLFIQAMQISNLLHFPSEKNIFFAHMSPNWNAPALILTVQ